MGHFWLGALRSAPAGMHCIESRYPHLVTCAGSPFLAWGSTQCTCRHALHREPISSPSYFCWLSAPRLRSGLTATSNPTLVCIETRVPWPPTHCAAAQLFLSVSGIVVARVAVAVRAMLLISERLSEAGKLQACLAVWSS